MTQNLTPSTQQQASESTERLQRVVEMVFAELHGQFGNKFLDAFRSGHVENGQDTGIENAKRVWGRKIVEQRLTPADIKRGLAGCSAKRFVPNWAEFLEACRPTPNVDAAIAEAVAQLHARNRGEDVWSHPAIYHAAQKVGYHEMTTLSTSALKPRFAAALDEVMRWESIPEIKPAIREEFRLEHAPVSADAVARAKAAVANFTHELLKPSGAPVDGLRWAHRLMAKERAGQRISLTQLEFAREALRLGAEPA